MLPHVALGAVRVVRERTGADLLPLLAFEVDRDGPRAGRTLDPCQHGGVLRYGERGGVAVAAHLPEVRRILRLRDVRQGDRQPPVRIQGEAEAVRYEAVGHHDVGAVVYDERPLGGSGGGLRVHDLHGRGREHDQQDGHHGHENDGRGGDLPDAAVDVPQEPAALAHHGAGVRSAIGTEGCVPDLGSAVRTLHGSGRGFRTPWCRCRRSTRPDRRRTRRSCPGTG